MIMVQIVMAAAVIASITYILFLRNRIQGRHPRKPSSTSQGRRSITYGGVGITATSCATTGVYSLVEPNYYDKLVIYSFLTIAIFGIALSCYGVIDNYRNN